MVPWLATGCTREALAVMEPRPEGKIINIASIAVLSALSAHSPHYSVTKGAVIGFTKAVAVDVAGANIFVNCIARGRVLTPDFEHCLAQLCDEDRNRFYQLIPLGRLGTPDEYASLAVYLATDGHYLVGQVLSPNCAAVIYPRPCRASNLDLEDEGSLETACSGQQ